MCSVVPRSVAFMRVPVWGAMKFQLTVSRCNAVQCASKRCRLNYGFVPSAARAHHQSHNVRHCEEHET